MTTRLDPLGISFKERNSLDLVKNAGPEKRKCASSVYSSTTIPCILFFAEYYDVVLLLGKVGLGFGQEKWASFYFLVSLVVR